ncbi:peptidoglycan-binding protein [Rhodoligotrophos defluvii]|uniref:peptidoglycan-binding protein n=1 Tax=Rhodoligotrophos defluvii TaxID=2561934 RepID=UPI00148570E6|nr:peptidoglycan-binding protein [Rhodoligotrophos defluvii]
MTRSGFGRGLSFALALATAAGLFAPAQAQEVKPPVSADGALVISGFSGTSSRGGGLFRSTPSLDETMIDLDGGSLKVFNVANAGGAPDAQLLRGAPILSVPARRIGQVFGIALDDAEAPNIYAAASSAFGLQLIRKPADGEAIRIKTGEADAAWMPGQFGEGGGPGSIWRIDGRTGAVTLFATIGDSDAANSGPGLGDIAFDPDHQQFFVSDFDTGLIHALDISGKHLGRFDHGVDGRKAADLAPVPDDGKRADITSAAFDSEDPESWGLTPVERRIWGLAYTRGRLYYAVWGGSEIWSVGITDSGAFANDARREITLSPEPKPYPVASLAFDGEGRLYAAQRGEIRSRYDYGTFALPRRSRVLRFTPAADGAWSPDPLEYAVGFPATHQNAAGGVALGYGYDRDGKLDTQSCWGTLWVTGDSLRESSRDAERLSRGGPLVVHGAQGLPLALTRADNLPPFKSYYLDYDDRFEDPNVAGHVGDIAAVQNCAGSRAVAAAESGEAGADSGTGASQNEQASPGQQAGPAEGGAVDQFGNPVRLPEAGEQPETPSASPQQGTDVTDPGASTEPSQQAAPGQVALPAPYDLSIAVRGGVERCAPTYGCPFTIIVTNNGPGPYRGPITIAEEVDTAVANLADWSPRSWSCQRRATTFACTRPNVSLEPGASVSLRVDFVPWRVPAVRVQNCARLSWSDGMLRARNSLVQESLAKLGYDVGPVDGLAGPKTREALRAFAADEGRRGGGEIDDALLSDLFGQWGNGDLRSSGDRDCASIPLRRAGRALSAAPDCNASSLLIEGRCVPLQTMCSGGRQFDAGENRCACPSDAPLWDVTQGRCSPYQPRLRMSRGGADGSAPSEPTQAEPEPSAPEPAPPAEPEPSAEPTPSTEPAPPAPEPDAAPQPEPDAATPPPSSSAQPAVPGDGGPAPSQPRSEPAPTAIVCPGDQRWDAESKQCKCPAERPIWDKISSSCIASPGTTSPRQDGEDESDSPPRTSEPRAATPRQSEPPKPQLQICSGGRVWSAEKIACVCPPDKPNWSEADAGCTP